MQQRVCYIVGAGAFSPRTLQIKKGDLLIAADGGYDALLSHGYTPHILLGDMDSLQTIPRHVPRMVFPRKKNDTDISLSLKYGIKKGYKKFILYGISGDRPDHFYANLQLMVSMAQRGYQLSAVLPEGNIYLLKDGTFSFQAPVGSVVSVFCPTGQALGVNTQGLVYPLHNNTLTSQFPLGVSNEMQLPKASISVRKGTLMVYLHIGKEAF